MKTYGAAPYGAELKKLEKQIKEKQTSVNEKIGVKVFVWLGWNMNIANVFRNPTLGWHHHTYGT